MQQFGIFKKLYQYLIYQNIIVNVSCQIYREFFEGWSLNYLYLFQVTTKKVQSGRPQSTADVRSLSGGERSFSTVCFVLALWDVADSPFRMLDEFDVFMVCKKILNMYFCH